MNLPNFVSVLFKMFRIHQSPSSMMVSLSDQQALAVKVIIIPFALPLTGAHLFSLSLFFSFESNAFFILIVFR